MSDTIDYKQPVAFHRLCSEHRIKHPSLVHHFEKQENGRYKPVLWNEVSICKSSTERDLAND